MALVSETLKANLSFAPQSALGEIPSYSCKKTKALLILMLKSGFLPSSGHERYESTSLRVILLKAKKKKIKTF